MVKRVCYYELLGINRSASIEEIRKAYKVQALRLHPDKNHHRLEEATKEFSQLQQAYTVLSDPHERKWYDNHREAILKGDDGKKFDEDLLFDLMPYFNASAFKGFTDGPKGFFSVYRRVFEDIDVEENRLFQQQQQDGLQRSRSSHYVFASFGYADTPFLPSLKDFYARWLHFTTLRTFSSMDKYHPSEAESRDHRRFLEKENKKIRDEQRKEYIDTVRALASFLKKRDPRVLAYQAAQKESDALKEQEKQISRAALAARKKLGDKLDDDTYQAPNWAQVNESEYLRYFEAHAASFENLDELSDEEQQIKESCTNEASDLAMDAEKGPESFADTAQPKARKRSSVSTMKGKSNERRKGAAPVSKHQDQIFECAACNKVFKSEKQWDNHEKSKKHLKAVHQLRKNMLKEDQAWKQQHEPSLNNESDEEEARFDDAISDVDSKTYAEDDSFFSDEEEVEGQGDRGDEMYQSDSLIDSNDDTDKDSEEVEEKKKTFDTTDSENDMKSKKCEEFDHVPETESEEEVTSDDSLSDTEIAPSPFEEHSSCEEDTFDVQALLSTIEKELENADMDAYAASAPKRRGARRISKKASQREFEQPTAQMSLPGKVAKSASKSTTSSSASLGCSTCKTSFPSRNALFSHLKTSGHAKSI